MSEKSTSFHEAVEKARQYEFRSLTKIITDMGVELRLLAALAEQSDSNQVDAARIVEIANRYEDEFLDVMRETVAKMKG